MNHILLKSHAGLKLPLAAVAEMKLACCCIWTVVMPLPPAEVVRPEVVVSQKLPLIVPTLPPTNPPIWEVPLMLPVE